MIVKENNKEKTSNGASLIEEMFKAGAHFGYSRTRRHPSFKPLIFGAKKNVDIVNLEKTGFHLTKALEFVVECAKNGKTFLLVGTKHEARSVIKKAAQTLNLPYVSKRWIGGTLTNFSEIKKRVSRLIALREQKEKGELEKYTKKEQLLFDREINRLEMYFGGIVNMTGTPDILFVIDPRHENTAMKEARQKSIPVVALANSDCDITNIAYPIPANDSSMASIIFFVDKFVKAYQEGKKKQELAVKNNTDNTQKEDDK